MIFILNALYLSGLLFCADTQDQDTSFKYGCVDLDNEPTTFRIKCSDGFQLRLGADSFFKFYQCSPVVQRSFENLHDEVISFPIDEETFRLIYDLITINSDIARSKLERMDSSKIMRVLSGLMDMHAGDSTRLFFKNLVFLKFENNSYSFCSSHSWNKFKSELSRFSQQLINGLMVENYKVSLTDKDLGTHMKLLIERPTGILIQSWLNKIAQYSFMKFVLPSIDSERLHTILLSKVAFSRDFKRFSLVHRTNEISQVYEYHYSNIHNKYLYDNEKIQIQECWYKLNNTRIAQHTSHFYSVDKEKRYLVSVDTNCGPCTYSNDIIAIGFSDRVTLKKIGESQKITSETHRFNNRIKQIIPYKKGFLVQFLDGMVSSLIPGLSQHTYLPLKLSPNETLERLMFDENVIIVRDDHDTMLKLYPLNKDYGITHVIPILVPISTRMYDIHDDAILTFDDNAVHCFTFTQPFIHAITAINTRNTAALSSIYDTITLNQ